MIAVEAAQQFQESAIRRIGALSARFPGLISFAAGYPAPDVFPWDDLQAITAQISGASTTATRCSTAPRAAIGR